jgi:cell division protein FtsA
LPQLLLSRDEAEEGVAIVDIGSDLTDVSIVKEGKLWYFSSLPIGASAINNDLHEFLKVSKKDIDKLKKYYGSATAD